MAMPPDGSSAWRKHADVWVLRNKIRNFASISVTVDGASAILSMPFSGSAYDWFYVARFARGERGVTVQLGDEGTPRSWSGVLVPVPITIRPRHHVTGEIAGAEPIATLVEHPDQSLALIDAVGRERVLIHRGEHPATAGVTRIAACGGALSFDCPSFPDTGLDHSESSMP